MKWKKKSEQLAANLEELQEILVTNRGIDSHDSQAVTAFLSPQHPLKFEVTDVGINPKLMKKAVTRIKNAVQDGEKIVIFADYDADGICAAAVLWLALTDLQPKTPIVPFIPHREKHGYGISIAALDEIIKEHNPSLIITVDNGIVAHEPIAYARKRGIDVILTDHHQPEIKDKKVVFPQATHVIHTTQLCGTTVAWMLARECNGKKAEELLDLCGIATIADQVPLLAANRSFAKFGIQALQKTKRKGIVELLQLASVKQEQLSEGTIGFMLAPRINAMGRLDHGVEALRLLCTTSSTQAQKLAQLLTDTNAQRQVLTQTMIEEAKQQVLTHVDENLIIVASHNYHEGILGLVAGGLMEQFHKPAIAISLSGEVSKGSARSIFGVNITDLLREIQSDLLSVGGHPLAAGFSFETAKFAQISKKIFALAKKIITAEQLEKSQVLECLLPSALIAVDTANFIESFSPFGMKNPRPVFAFEPSTIADVTAFGKANEHLKMQIEFSDNQKKVTVLGWQKGEKAQQLQRGMKIQVAGSLDSNEWKSVHSVQILLKDVITLE